MTFNVCYAKITPVSYHREGLVKTEVTSTVDFKIISFLVSSASMEQNKFFSSMCFNNTVTVNWYGHVWFKKPRPTLLAYKKLLIFFFKPLSFLRKLKSKWWKNVFVWSKNTYLNKILSFTTHLCVTSQFSLILIIVDLVTIFCFIFCTYCTCAGFWIFHVGSSINHAT